MAFTFKVLIETRTQFEMLICTINLLIINKLKVIYKQESNSFVSYY